MWNTALFPGSDVTAGRFIVAAAATDDNKMVLSCNYDSLKFQLNNIKHTQKSHSYWQYGMVIHTTEKNNNKSWIAD